MDGVYYTSGLVYDGAVTCVQQPTLVVSVSKTSYAKTAATDVFYYGSMHPVIKSATVTKPEISYQGLGIAYARMQSCGPILDSKAVIFPANSGGATSSPFAKNEVALWYGGSWFGTNIQNGSEKISTMYETFAPLDGNTVTYTGVGSLPLSADRFTTGTFKSGYFIPSTVNTFGVGYVNGQYGLTVEISNGLTSWCSTVNGLYRLHRPFDPSQQTTYWRIVYGTGFTGASPWTFSNYDTAFEGAPHVMIGHGNYWLGRGGTTTLGLARFNPDIDPTNSHFQMTVFDDATLNAYLYANNLVPQATPIGFILNKNTNYSGVTGVAKYGDFILVSPDATKWWVVKVNVKNYTNGSFLPNMWAIDELGILYGICTTTSGVTDVWSSFPNEGPWPWTNVNYGIASTTSIPWPCVATCKSTKLQMNIL